MVIKDHVIKNVPYALLVWALESLRFTLRALYPRGKLSSRGEQGNSGHYFLKPVGDRNVRRAETFFQTR